MEFWFENLAPQPVLLALGAFQVRWYSVLIILGIVTAFFLARRRFLRSHADDKQLVDIAFYSVIGGIIGARLWHVFVFQYEYYLAHPTEIIRIWEGGIAIQGALIGGFIALLLYARNKNVSVFSLTDSALPVVPLAQAIGRWGNFFNQELYGKPTDVPWAIYIEAEHRIVGFEQFSYFHPTFFYESFLNVALFVILWKYSSKNRVLGSTTALYMIGYGCVRFIVDWFRIDPMPGVGILRSSQIISIIFIVGGILLLSILKKRGIVKDLAKE